MRIGYDEIDKMEEMLCESHNKKEIENFSDMFDYIQFLKQVALNEKPRIVKETELIERKN